MWEPLRTRGIRRFWWHGAVGSQTRRWPCGRGSRGTVRSAAINLVSGGRLFAFKIGWDSELAKGSPGVLHEAELLGQVTGPLRNLTLMDSCATETSYIAGVWPDRIPVATGIVCFTPWARLTRRVYDAGRRVKHWVEGWRQSPAKQPPE
jgi:hypothetical protein